MAKVNKPLWYGEAEIIGYNVRVLAESERKAKQLLLAQHRKSHRLAHTGVQCPTWAHLEEITDCRVLEMELGKVVWP